MSDVPTEAEIDAVWKRFGIERYRDHDMTYECRLAAHIIKLEKAVVHLQKGDKCRYEGCVEFASQVASGRQIHRYSDASGTTETPGHPEPAVYCDEHASKVAGEDCPEYCEHCPNCGCMFGG